MVDIIDDSKNELLTVEVSLEILKKYCLWSIIKYFKDDYHTQQNSSRNDLLGGFMDRWINRIPESLIFQKLLESEEGIEVVNDDFFYIDESAKNAPDVIGLLKENSGVKLFYPFYTFNLTNWEKFDEDAPFIEMKTTRKSQKLATITKRRDRIIDDKFFVLVESDINKNYFLYLMDQEIFNNNFEFVSSNIFLKNKNYMKLPNEVIDDELKKLKDEGIILKDEKDVIGNYKLCGIFKGTTIRKYASEVGLDEDKGEPINPRYLKYIDELKGYKEFFNNSITYDYCVDEIKCIPFLIDIPENSHVFVEDYDDNNVIIRVYGKISLMDISYKKSVPLDEGFYKLNFNNFITNLFKYYYLEDIIKLEKYSIDYFKSKRIKLGSGLFCFYGDEFRNNIFTLKPFIDGEFEIYKMSKSSVDCYTKNEIHYSEKTFNNYFKLKFNDNGTFNKNDSRSIRRCKKNSVLYEYLKENDFHLYLNINLDQNSKIWLIEKYGSYFTVCIEGNANISDNNNFSEDISNNFYRFDIKRGALDKKSIIENPFKKDKELKVDENNFFIPDDDKTNIKVKFDIYDEKSKIFVVKDGLNSSNQISFLDIIIDGKAWVDGYEIIDDSKNIFKRCWRLKFDNFERTSKIEEYVLSKSAIIASNESCEDELIKIFHEYIDKLDKII